MAFPDHFSAASTGYAAFRPAWPDSLAAELAGIAPRGPRTTAWDVGCGSGQLTTVLARYVERIEATDASAAQITQATPAPGVRYRVAPAEDSGLADGSVGLVVVAQAVHWFDLPAFYAEVHRVAPGGVIALLTYAGLTVHPAIDPIVHDFQESLVDGFWPPERAHVDSGYTNLPFPFEPVPFGAHALTARHDVEDLLGYVDTWSAVRALERAGRREDFEAFARDVRRAWPGGVWEVTWPIAARVGRLRDR